MKPCMTGWRSYYVSDYFSWELIPGKNLIFAGSAHYATSRRYDASILQR